MPAATPPPGQLVQVRRRQFLVQGVRTSGLVRDSVSPPQHRVKLTSIEEDALGEEIANEMARIRVRLEAPRPPLFPISVTWLLAAGGLA